MTKVVKGSLLLGTLLFTGLLASVRVNAADPVIYPQSYGFRHAYCPECTTLAREYNSVVQRLHETQARLDNAKADFKMNTERLTKEQAKIKGLTDAANKAADKATAAATAAMAADAAAAAAQPVAPAPAPTAAPSQAVAPTQVPPAAQTPAPAQAPIKAASPASTPAAPTATAPVQTPAQAPAPAGPKFVKPTAEQIKADQYAAETADEAAKASDALTKSTDLMAQSQKNIENDIKIVAASQTHIAELMAERSNVAEELNNCESQSCGYKEESYKDSGCVVNPPDFPMPMPYPHKHVECSYCLNQTIHYNDLVDALFDVQKTSRNILIDRSIDKQAADKAQKRINKLASKRNLPQYKAQYDNAVMDYNRSARLYKIDNEKLSVQNNVANNLHKQLDKAAEANIDCQNDNCRPLKTKSPEEIAREKSFIAIPMEYQAGMFLGAAPMRRTANASGPYGTFTESTVRGQTELGAQVNVLFGSPDKDRFMVLGNMLWMMGPSETLLAAQVNPASVSNSTLHINYDWLAHLGAGMQTKPYYHGRLRFQFGPGLAIVHQNLATSVVDGTTGTHNRIDRKDIRASLWGGLTYDLCEACFYKHPVALIAQIFADNYGSESVSGVTPLNNNYVFTANQSWQFHEQLGLVTKF